MAKAPNPLWDYKPHTQRVKFPGSDHEPGLRFWPGPRVTLAGLQGQASATHTWH